MLLEFEVENFRSFADPVRFSMIASSDRSHADHLIVVEGSRDRLMRSASIYGANASGKSTLLRCIIAAQKPQMGTVALDGDNVYRLSPRSLASRIACARPMRDLTTMSSSCGSKGLTR